MFYTKLVIALIKMTVNEKHGEIEILPFNESEIVRDVVGATLYFVIFYPYLPQI